MKDLPGHAWCALMAVFLYQAKRNSFKNKRHMDSEGKLHFELLLSVAVMAV